MVGLQYARSSSREIAHGPLTHQIRRQLTGSGWGALQLNIEDDGQIVTLRGVATSFYQRQLWLHRAMQVVGGDRQLHDEILVSDGVEAESFAG